jgi:hypothetical protein
LEITILHIYGAQSTALMMKSIDSILIRNAEKQLHDVIKEMTPESPEVIFKTKLAKKLCRFNNFRIRQFRILRLYNYGNQGS